MMTQLTHDYWNQSSWTKLRTLTLSLWLRSTSPPCLSLSPYLFRFLNISRFYKNISKVDLWICFWSGERGSSCNGLHQDDRRVVDLQPHRPLHPHRHPHIHGHSQAVSQKLIISPHYKVCNTYKCNLLKNHLSNSVAVSQTTLSSIFVTSSKFILSGKMEMKWICHHHLDLSKNWYPHSVMQIDASTWAPDSTCMCTTCPYLQVEI